VTPDIGFVVFHERNEVEYLQNLNGELGLLNLGNNPQKFDEDMFYLSRDSL